MRRIFSIFAVVSMVLWFGNTGLANVPTNGLVAYYPFNGNANDESGNGNHGTVNGATLTTDRNGKDSSAYFFDGNDYIRVSNFDLSTNDFTLSFFIQAESLGMSPIAIHSGGGGHNHGDKAIWFLYENPETVRTYFSTQDGTHTNVSLTATGIKKSTWYHVVFLRSGNTEKLYIDGVMVSSDEDTLSSFVFDNGFIDIGAPNYYNGGWYSGGYRDTRFWNGKVDDISLHNRALSESEIQQLYNTDCTVDITGSSMAGTLQPNKDITFHIDAQSDCDSTIYYRFSYHPDYGTDGYDGYGWMLMTNTEYTTNNECTYSFSTAGKYIVVVWAVSDSNNVESNGVPIMGFSVNIRENGPTIGQDEPYFPF